VRLEESCVDRCSKLVADWHDFERHTVNQRPARSRAWMIAMLAEVAGRTSKMSRIFRTNGSLAELTLMVGEVVYIIDDPYAQYYAETP